MQIDALASFHRLCIDQPRRQGSLLRPRSAQDLRAGASAEGSARDRGGAPHRRGVRIERKINGLGPERRRAVRLETSRMLVDALADWMPTERKTL
jgi:DNA-directed RNA polymerase specialized sigma24 family protein